MRYKPTIFLRYIILGISTGVLWLSVMLLLLTITSKANEYAPIFIGMCVSAVPFFYAVRQSLEIMDSIDANQMFSDASVAAINKIKISAVAIGGLYTIGLPYIFFTGERDDAPGVILLAILIIFASIVVGVFASLCQKLLQNAIDIKSENDLTV